MLNECKIVEDLLPLYAEELVSEETAEFVREHSSRCERCQKLLQRCKEVEPMKTVDIPNYKKALKKDRGRSVMTGALITIIVLALLMGVFVVGYIPIKEETEPIMLESPDGSHWYKAEPYSSLFDTNQGLYIIAKHRNGISEGSRKGWMEILDAQWSPDGTDLFFAIELKSGETRMEIWYNNYYGTGGSHGVFPLISKNWETLDINDLTAEFTSLLAEWEKFPTGWESIAYEFIEWGEDSESAYIHYETDNGYEGTVYFGFDFEGQAIWIIE